MSSTEALYEEIYFDEFYRVLVIREGDTYIVSVDVYSKRDNFEYSNRTCTDDVCLLIREVGEVTSLHEILHGVLKILVVAVKVRDNPVEIVNVKWILNRKPSGKEIKEIYKLSWQLATSA